MIKNIFATEIWEADCPNYNKEENVRKFDEYINRVGTNKLNYIINNSDTTQIPNPTVEQHIPGYTYPDYNIQDMGMPELWLWINKQIVKYHTYCGYTNADSSQASGAWVTSGPKGGRVVSHNHNPSTTAGVFYVDAEPERGNLYLLNPNEMVIARNQRTSYNFRNKWYEFLVQSGRLILFPGYLYHQVPENPTNDRRKIISFDAR